MNQILSVNPNNNRNSKKSNLRTVLIVFSIILMLFGMVVAGTGVYSYFRNIANNQDDGLEVSTNTKPIISIEREDASKIKISVTHDKELETVKYWINNGEPEEINTNAKSEVSKSIDLPSGTTTVKIMAEDVNGVSSSREDVFEVEEQVIKLERIEGQIKITVEKEEGIDHVSYYWDEDLESGKTLTINSNKTETLVDAIEGTHTLNVIAVDIQGKEYKKSQSIKGVKKPKLDVKTNGQVFKIDASDEEALTKIEIKLNSNEIKTEEINGKEYTTMINLEDGENKLIVKVYNSKDVSTTAKVKFTKE